MQDFNAKAATAGQVLEELGVAFQRRSDGTIFVPGDLDLSRRALTALPDLSTVEVAGNFWCNGNALVSLRGSPYKVGGSYYCCENQLVSLAGAPETVGGGFYCQDNLLPSMTGGPRTVGDTVSCFRNPMTSLEGMPQTFHWMCSDFGGFPASSAVPERFRHAPTVSVRI
jgi:hypothetical protein